MNMNYFLFGIMYLTLSYAIATIVTSLIILNIYKRYAS